MLFWKCDHIVIILWCDCDHIMMWLWSYYAKLTPYLVFWAYDHNDIIIWSQYDHMFKKASNFENIANSFLRKKSIMHNKMSTGCGMCPNLSIIYHPKLKKIIFSFWTKFVSHSRIPIFYHWHVETSKPHMRTFDTEKESLNPKISLK